MFCIFVVENKMDQISKLIDPSRQNAKDSLKLVKRCKKPDRKGISLLSERLKLSIRVLIVLLLYATRDTVIFILMWLILP